MALSFQVCSHLLCSNLMRRKSKPCHSVRVRQHLQREVPWLLSRCKHYHGVHISAQCCPFWLNFHVEAPLVSFPDRLIMSHLSPRRGPERTGKRVTKANLNKKYIYITVLTRKKQRLLRNTIIEIMHHELEVNSVIVLQLIQQCQIAYNILKMIIRTSTIQEEK